SLYLYFSIRSLHKNNYRPLYDFFRIRTNEVKKAKVELEILTDQANFIGGSKFGKPNLQANWDMFWSMVDTCAKKCPKHPGGGDLVPLGNDFGNQFKEKA
ncbi:MAG TPA: hypothetical protein PK581_09065, partial [Caldisericia bacterium]|nr:hypothetical protein [Caldisericia bacterium]